MTEKASKFSIDQIYDKLQEYTPTIEMEKLLERLKNKIINVSCQLDKSQERLEKEVKDIQGSLSTSLGKIALDVENRITHRIKQTFIDRDELNSRLFLKADLEEVKNLDEIKAERTVANDTILAVNLLFKQLELSVIISTE